MYYQYIYYINCFKLYDTYFNFILFNCSKIDVGDIRTYKIFNFEKKIV